MLMIETAAVMPLCLMWLTLVLVHRAVERAPVEALPDIVERLLMLIALITLLYLVAPTAQQLVALSVRFRIGAGGRP